MLAPDARADFVKAVLKDQRRRCEGTGQTSLRRMQGPRTARTFGQAHLLASLLANVLDLVEVGGVCRLHQNAVRLDVLDK